MLKLSPGRLLAGRDALYNWMQSGWFDAWPPISRHRRERYAATYNSQYYEFIEYSAAWSRDTMADSIVNDLDPRLAVDVGCGTGALMEALGSRAVQVTGLEFSDAALELCQKRGLAVRKFDIARQPLPSDLRRQDLALSFEVAEHLPARLANRFVQLLSSASDTVVMSAATPGQGGTDHVNEQPHEYWIKKMARRGFYLDQDLTMRWRTEWRDKTANWYHSNVMIFRRARKLAEAA